MVAAPGAGLMDFAMLASLVVPVLNYAGAVCLCLAKERHFAALVDGGAKPARITRRRLRQLGWAGLALASVASLLGLGIGQGALLWCGSFSAGAILLSLSLPFARDTAWLAAGPGLLFAWQLSLAIR